ncbi:MAG TPA: wax ester/triacylglycerol synthase family O-acyltransferase [Mycobacteriales bacterium]
MAGATERLSPLDVSFLYLEEPTTPMHVGGVAVFSPPSDAPVDYERIVSIIEERIDLFPRYRQRVRGVPGHLANPVWVDDVDFDVTYHVRRSALPRPGSDAQLRELVGRLMSRPLDRDRPLWEIYLVEGLAEGRIALITKTHHAMVDGRSAMDIGALILDTTPEPRQTEHDPWQPGREPGRVQLVAGALRDVVRRPLVAVDAVRSGVVDAKALSGRALDAASGLLSAARIGLRQAPDSPLNADIGRQRRYGMCATALEDYKRVRQVHGGTVNDVVLAAVAGGLRAWLLTRGEPVTGRTSLRAMVPVSVRPSGAAGDGGNKVSSYFVDLPVGEPNPVVRLTQVSYAMQGVKEQNQTMGADAIIALSGFAPPTLHALGARLASSLTRRLFNLVVTNVPGPQFPLYAAGAPMESVYPVVPLAKGQAVCIGVTSYNGGVFYGLNADRDAMPDVDVLAQCIGDAVEELVATVPGRRHA